MQHEVHKLTSDQSLNITLQNVIEWKFKVEGNGKIILKYNYINIYFSIIIE